jgi:hypothetical protein
MPSKVELKWADIAEKMRVKADETNDRHDHDELHAASMICVLLSRGEYLYYDYICRWLEGLIKLHNLEP